MRWTISTLIPLFATINYGVIFALVSLSKPRTRMKEVFGLYLLTMLLWSVSGFLVLSGLVVVLPWFRMMRPSTIAMMLAFFFFVQTLFGFRRKWAPMAIVYGILAIPATIFTSLVVQSASLDQAGRLQYNLGLVFVLVAAPGY